MELSTFSKTLSECPKEPFHFDDAEMQGDCPWVSFVLTANPYIRINV